MSSTIQVRVDDELKEKSDSLFKSLGTDTTTAIRMFLVQAVANNGFPFEIRNRSRQEDNPYISLPEEQILEKLAKSRIQAENGNCRLADDAIAELREKYGL